MKTILTFFTFLNSFVVLTQLDSIDTLGPRVLPKNQILFSQNWAALTGNDSRPYFEFGYQRLIKTNNSKKNDSINFQCKYLFTSLAISDFTKPLLVFDELFLTNITDSMIIYRGSGQAIRNHDFKIGIENQQKIFQTKNKLSGIQFIFAYYGILGFTKKFEQYIYISQKTFTSHNVNSSSTIIENPYPLVGERITNYLRVGFGTVFGFDYLMATSQKKNLSIGLNFSLFNLTGAFIVNSRTAKDPDNLYSEAPKSFFLDSDLAFNIRFGFAF